MCCIQNSRSECNCMSSFWTWRKWLSVCVFVLVLSMRRMIQTVKESHPMTRKPELIDLGDGPLPSLRDLQASYERLREQCMPCKCFTLGATSPVSAEQFQLSSFQLSCSS